MSKKNISLILSSLALLSAAGLSAEEQLEHTNLGTGEEIRAEVLPVAYGDDDYDDDDDDRRETDAQRRARLRREAEQRRNRNGNKSTQEKCGRASCS